MTAQIYNAAFYDRADKSAVAARRIVALVKSMLSIESVLDVGCARGTWLAAWLQSGCSDIVGIDGFFVERDKLVIDRAHFVAIDLAAPFALGRRFDLAQCLEVAEHLPRTRSASLVADLVAHADAVLFSAAPAGQGGAGHINENSPDFWRELFARHDYLPFDCVRPCLRGESHIPYWYRYNILLYVKVDRVDLLSQDARAGAVLAGAAIPDVAPVSFRLRKFILRILPSVVIDVLANLVARNK